ncbi:hypothetical protein BDB00DRAFT_872420 [Zychaea mexicana]|uniref:uncharacterized protein n=1 Tax=Zychaea mexicana TaxID=64656 RepID=UPI0022FE1130|nr:uncharacterized protein BDB00DRAFT_872420 [Zychaea mexicana]KAI9493316.1 hypothetical protein BDB00DRAFT_872420 [Zychaea mexicana]
MIFSHRTVKSFRLSISPGGSERLVAFGPGAILSGSVFLTLDKPLRAHNIRVAFRCEQKSNRAIKTLFNVESIIWGKPRSVDRAAGDELKEGCHMYLFAIKLPNVNYPPSMQDNELCHRVDYTLQGFLDLHDQRAMETAPARVMYLPLISCVTDELPPKETQEFKRGSNNRLQLTLQAARPAYCPGGSKSGDNCTVKLITKNRSEHKISSFQVALVAMAGAAAAAADKTHTVHSETIYAPMGKYANNTSVCNFQIPSHCAPSLGNITYQIVVTLPWGASSWKFPSSLNNVSISIPITIATVPATYPVPPHLQLPLPSFLLQENGAALPSFIPNIESPDPSPMSPVSIDVHSPSPSLSLNENTENDHQSLDGRTLCDGWPGGGHHHYASPSAPSAVAGYLTVPASSPNHHHHLLLRRSSTSSVLTDCSAEINSVYSDSSSCTRVAVQ